MIIGAVCGLLTIVIVMSNAAGPLAAGHGGRTGASFDSGACGGAGCHSGGTFLAPTVVIQLLIGGSPVSTYVPGASYTLKIKVSSASISTLGYKWGMQTTCIADANDTGINNWGVLPTTVHSGVWNGRTYLEQNATLLSASTPFLSIPWTAPPAGTGTVKFFVGGCLVNGNLLPTGDSPVNDSLTLTEDTAGCILPSVTPSIFDVSCGGGSDGSIDIMASGGTGVSAYNWTGPSGFVAATANIAGLSTGTYTLVMTVVGGCYDTLTEYVGQPAPLADSLVGIIPVCNGGTLSLTANISGGTLPYTYNWTTPASMGFATPGFSISPFTSTDTGLYWLSITDDNGCIYDTSIDIGFGPGPVFSMTSDTTVCGLDSLVLGIAPISGDSYSWSSGGTDPTMTIYSLFTSSYNVYSLTVTDASGCSTTDTVAVITCPLVVNTAVTPAFGIFPNPANDMVHIEGLGTTSEILIFDLTGVVVEHINTANRTSVDLDVRNLTPGLYTISFYSPAGRDNRKLNIIR